MSQRKCLLKTAREEITVDGLFLPSQHPDSDLRFLIVETAGEPVLLGVENIGNARHVRRPFNAFDSAGKNPRMTVEDRPFTALFQVNELHGE